MKTQLESTLLSLPPEQWQVKQAIVLDWHDGPRMGICEMLQPNCSFRFDILAERSLADDLNDCLFTLSETPHGIMKELLAILAELGSPETPIWVPRWSFESEEIKQEIEQKIDDLLTGLKRTNIIVRTSDMFHFTGYWMSV